MKLNKYLSSYPILISEDDDYINSSFNATIKTQMDFNKLIIDAHFSLNDDGLKKLIEENKARYAIHVDCPLLSNRHLYMTDKTDTIIELNLNELDDLVEISSVIISIEDINNYKNSNFNKMFGDEGFNIDKGNYLAIGPFYEMNINRSNYGDKQLKDIIKIQKSDSNSNEMSVSLEQDIIIIYVNETIKNQYYVYGKQYLYNVVSMILVPSMIYILTQMKNNPDLNSYAWYGVIERLLDSNGIYISDLKVEDSSGKNSIFEIAQKIFKSPLEKGLSELDKYNGVDDNYGQ